MKMETKAGGRVGWGQKAWVIAIPSAWFDPLFLFLLLDLAKLSHTLLRLLVVPV